MLPGVWGSYATGDEPERKYRFWPGVAKGGWLKEAQM